MVDDTGENGPVLPSGVTIERINRARDANRVILEKWTSTIVFVLATEGTMRFNRILSMIPGMTSTMLTTRLREMEDYGMVTREVYPEVPVRVEYSLTERSMELIPILTQLMEWAEKYYVENRTGRSSDPTRPQFSS